MSNIYIKLLEENRIKLLILSRNHPKYKTYIYSTTYNMLDLMDDVLYV